MSAAVWKGDNRMERREEGEGVTKLLQSRTFKLKSRVSLSVCRSFKEPPLTLLCLPLLLYHILPTTMPTALPRKDSAQATWSQHPTRMPTAASSLRVQLPPSDFVNAFASSSSTTSGARPAQQQQRPSSSALLPPSRTQQQQGQPLVPPPPPQSSDASILAQGILEQRRKGQEILAWQERLMEDRPISREELKRGLTRISIPYWLQVLQERSIYGLCGYPRCRNRLEASASSASSSSRPGQYRISVSRRAIERDTSNEPGGRNNFCSPKCHGRAEWVRRWVLNPAASSTSSHRGASLVEDPAAARMRRIGEEQALLGGKWEAMTNRREDQWNEIELLEDMEDNGDLDDWEGFEGASSSNDASRDHQATSSREEPSSTSTDHPTAEPPGTPASTSRPPTSLLETLTISERTPAVARDFEATANSSSAPSSTARPSVLADDQDDRQTEDLEDWEIEVDASDDESEEEEDDEEQRAERRMIDEAMMLRDELRAKGELE